jgi:hypothetical protein
MCSQVSFGMKSIVNHDADTIAIAIALGGAIEYRID